MVTLTLQIGIELRYTCVQCGKDMVIERKKEMNPQPVLKCPDCGFRVKIGYGQAAPQIPGVQQRIPPFRPEPKT